MTNAGGRIYNGFILNVQDLNLCCVLFDLKAQFSSDGFSHCCPSVLYRNKSFFWRKPLDADFQVHRYLYSLPHDTILASYSGILKAAQLLAAQRKNYHYIFMILSFLIVFRFGLALTAHSEVVKLYKVAKSSIIICQTCTTAANTSNV